MSARDALVGTIYTFIHPIYGNQNHAAQAVAVVQKQYFFNNPQGSAQANSPPLEGWPMHFAMHAFSSHVEVLNEVTPIDLLVQSAVLFSLTGWLPRGAVEKVSTNRRGGLTCPPVTRWPARFIHSSIQFMETKTIRRKRLVSCRTVLKGRHTGLPLRLGGYYKFTTQAVTVARRRYFFNSPQGSALVNSPPLEGWPMHFAMHAFSSHVEVLNEVTPIDLLVQSAVLFSLTGWLSNMETIIGWCKQLQLFKNSTFSTTPYVDYNFSVIIAIVTSLINIGVNKNVRNRVIQHIKKDTGSVR